MPRHSPYALCSLNFLVLFISLLENRNIVFVWLSSFEKTLVYHPSAKLYQLPLFVWKDQIIIFIASFYLFVFYSLFKDQRKPFSDLLGRSGWTRTIDLTLIRRAL